ncbi:MAG: hypothetical protein K2Q22_17190, partial [Cytophagales bacterium]|nr:hypothetical protein [Cytophagales bacterium]
MKRLNYIALGVLLCLYFIYLEAAPVRDRKLKFISDLLVNGMNEEAIVRATNYLKKAKSDSLNDNVAYATTFKALALWSEYQFAEAKSTVDALRNQVTKSNSASANLALSVYYLNTQEVALASEYIDAACKGINLSNLSRLETDIILQKAKVLMVQGYTIQSLEWLGKIEVYGKRLADGQGELDQDKLYNIRRWNSNYYKERYSEILLTRCQALVAKGDLNEAEKQFDFLKRWITKSNGKGHPLYQKACFEEANLYKAKEKPFSALNNYIEAYLTNERPESDPLKLQALVEIFKSYCELGFPVESQNYLRRIQMYAFRNAGMEEPNEFAYQWSAA